VFITRSTNKRTHQLHDTARDPRCPIKREEEEEEDAFCLEWFDYSNDLNTIETEIDLLTERESFNGGLVDENHLLEDKECEIKTEKNR